MEFSSLEAEAAILGGLILAPSRIPLAAGILLEQDFYYSQNQIVFNALKAVGDKVGDDLCMILVRDYLKKNKLMKQIGGVGYLVKLAESVPSAANFNHYADIVMEKSRHRSILKEVEKFKADTAEADSEEIVIAAQRLADSIHPETSKDVTALKDHLSDAHDAMYNRKDCVYSGFDKLDQIIPGFEGGDIIIIAARPSIGKTSLAISMAVNMVKNHDPVLFFSFEMTKLQLAERIICAEASISPHRAKKGLLHEGEKTKMLGVMNSLYALNWPLYFTDYGINQPEHIRTKIVSEQRIHNIKCVFIDFLQMMRVGEKVQSRNYEIGQIVDFLKITAKKCNIPIILLCQLNRGAESRDDKMPRIGDLRDSGEIEQASDVVCLLHRPGYYDREVGDGAIILVPKQRRGPIGEAYITFEPELARFVN
ncbi:hypothetical protein LCGC14_1146150 [marine sediment metagenome]|uniref:DNA 5'-3' helicase n=1 Tax=marine sediment metagenome TaxID=412755 RepID=A0A0F9PEY3_9ZZZZ